MNENNPDYLKKIQENAQAMLANNNTPKFPNIKTVVTKSKNKRWIITKTIITDIRSVDYYKKVCEDDTVQTSPELQVEEEHIM